MSHIFNITLIFKELLLLNKVCFFFSIFSQMQYSSDSYGFIYRIIY